MQQNKHLIQDKISRQNGRWTHARELVLQAFEKSKRPMTVSDIHRQLSGSGIDLASVYRAVNLFCKHHMVYCEDVILEGKRYALSESQGAKHHHYLVCESCGKTEEYSNCVISKVEKQISKKTKFLIKWHDLKLIGVCKNCNQ